MLDFFGTIGGAIMAPLYYVISAVLVGWHKLFGSIFGPETGIAWVLSIIGLTLVIRIALIPLFVLYRRIGLVNTPYSVIILYTVAQLPFATSMFRAFFDGIPQDLEEAATIDGASRLRAFLLVVLPRAGPAIAAHGGVFLARGSRYVQLEGADRARNVVARFPSVEDAVACYNSPEYQAALDHARNAAERDLVIVEENPA